MPLVQQFEQLWGSTAVPPDVFAFLKQQQSVDSQQWLGILLADQQRRWATDNPWKVEDYLAGLPDLPGNVDWKLQLAIGEFEARRETDRPLSAQEISSRFPELGDTLRDRSHGPRHELRLSLGPESVQSGTVSGGTGTGRASGAIGQRHEGRVCGAATVDGLAALVSRLQPPGPIRIA